MINYEQLNDLPTDVKLLIANGQTLVNRTRELMKEKAVDKDIKELELAIIRLKTSSEALLGLK